MILGKLLVLCVLVIYQIHVIQSIGYDNWDDWKANFGKVYVSQSEESLRRDTYNRNKQIVETHNSDPDRSYDMEMNQFADLTTEEFQLKILNVKISINLDLLNLPLLRSKRGLFDGLFPTTQRTTTTTATPAPASKDWVAEGFVTRVKDQGSCGSCWAFATSGAIEALHKRKTGQLVELSEENLVDCTPLLAPNTNNCQGNTMEQAYNYVKINGGVQSESTYAYQGVDDACKYNAANKVDTVSGFTTVTPANSESALKAVIGNIGPVSVPVNGTALQLYGSGIMTAQDCTATMGWMDLNHAVVLVGYGTTTGAHPNFWTIKNSWGPNWGESGFARIARNENNQICIATLAQYPN